MELAFSELDNVNPYEVKNNYEENDEPYQYWEEAKKQKTNKKVSFNDILSNMSLVVNKNGTLQSIQSSKSINEENLYETSQDRQQSIPQMVKNSVIYNKYFKDYVDERVIMPEKKVPKTIKEYNEMVREYKIKRFEERKKMSEIKSTKLLFTNNTQDSRIIHTKIKPKQSRNNLKRMGFW